MKEVKLQIEEVCQPGKDSRKRTAHSMEDQDEMVTSGAADIAKVNQNMRG